MSTTTQPISPNATTAAKNKTGEAFMIADRRIAPRQKPELAAEIRPLGLNQAHHCSIGDISEGGLFVCTPLSYGLNVGQRCEVVFSAHGGRDSSPSPADGPCYATVVRTEVLAEGSKKLLGAGLRFDQPLFL